MKPICSKTITMNQNGRITIPKTIRDRYGLSGKVALEIQLLRNHTIQLIPEAPYRERFIEKLKQSEAEKDE